MKGKGTQAADLAIRMASTGKITVEEMLKKVISAQVFVPLAAPPEMDGTNMKSWQPATVSHTSRGDYLLAFTDEDCRSTFGKNNPIYKFGIVMDTSFLMTALPPKHGILFNMGGESCFEWDAKGIAGYQQTIGLKTKLKRT